MLEVTQRTFPIAMLALGALLLAPATGYAQGNSGVDQYREGVPTGGGEIPTEQVSPGSGDGDGGGGSPVGDSTRQALSSAGGSEGTRLAELAGATAPKRADRRGGATRGGADAGRGNKGGADAGASVAPQTAVQNALSSNPGGLGWGLPALMGVGLLAAIAFRIRSRSLDRA